MDNRHGRSDYRDRRHSGGGGRNYKGRFPPRQSREPPPEPPEQIIASLLFQVGEQGEKDSLEGTLEQLATSLETRLSRDRGIVLRIIVPMVFAQPTKTSLYATLVGLLNARVPDMGRDILGKVEEAFGDAFNAIDPFKFRMLVRFCTELIETRVIEAESVMSLLERMMSQAEKDSATMGRSVRSEFYLCVIADALPYVGKTLTRLFHSRFTAILTKMDQYFQQRDQTFSDRSRQMLSAFCSGKGSQARNWDQARWNELVVMLTPHGQGDWSDITESSWSIFDSYITRPNQDAFTAELDRANPLTLNVPSLPTQITEQNYQRRLQSEFSLFDTSKTEHLGAAATLIIRQYFIDLFAALSTTHKMCMQKLLSLPFGNDLDHLLVESLFSQIFQLPVPSFKLIYYNCLMVDGYKASKSFADTVQDGVDLLYGRLDQMDAECFDRFSEWFSFYLSSIDWKWDWDNWSDVLDQPESSHQRRWIREVLEQCVRLSYHDRVVKTLPDAFHALLPVKPTPVFAYHETDVGDVLLERVYQRESGDELRQYLEGLDSVKTNEARLTLLLQVLLQRGHKSSTHILKLFERYLSLLQSMITSTTTKIVALQTVHSYWTNCPQNVIIIVDKLMTYCIVDNVSIVRWILNSKSASFLKHGFMWIILRKTFEKTLARFDTIKSRIRQLEQGEIRFDDDPRDPEEIKLRKLAALEEQKDQSRDELESLLSVAIECFSQLLETPAVAQDEFLHYRVRYHLIELLRKHAPFVKNLMSSQETRSQLLSVGTEEVGQVLETTSSLHAE